MHAGKLFKVSLLSALLCLTSGCASMGRRDPVEAYVVGVEPLQGAGLEFRMLVKLRVQNPNDMPIAYDGVSVSMNVQGKRFATGVSDAAGTISRFGEAVIDVPVSISAFRLVGRAMEVLGTQGTDKIEYELRGKLAGPAFNSVRFNSKGEMKLPEGFPVDKNEPTT
jgi:LEA14-like dessication related protein